MSPCITPLHLSSCRGLADDVRQLGVVLDVDPQALHRLQHSLSFEFALPLMCAAEAGHPECLALLLQRGASVAATDREGRRAVFYAVRSGSASCVELLLSGGAEVNFMELHRTPTTRYLEMACQAGLDSVVEVLMRHGALSADPKQLRSPPHSPSYLTPLTISALEGNTQCLKWLLLYGACADFSHLPEIRPEVATRNKLLHVLTDLEVGKATLEQRKDMFSLLYEFGFDLSAFSGDQQRVQQLLGQRNQHRHLLRGSSNSEALATFIARMLNTPRTLQSTCRVRLRKALGTAEYTAKLRELRVSAYNRKISESRLNGYLHFHHD